MVGAVPTSFAPSARVLADSITPAGHRVTTVELVHHRFVLGEINTHRVKSRNGASSRAIPVSKRIDEVVATPAMPLAFGTNQPGMQPGPPLTGAEEAAAIASWLRARDAAVTEARYLSEQLNVHKELVSRLLEPFLSQKTIMTATTWSGFFDQRCTPDGEEEGLAQRELRAPVDLLRAALDASTPTLVEVGGWHLPLIQDDEWDLPLETIIQISVARCARVSYLTHNGIKSIDKDLELYERLTTETPPHWSPLEHVCTPDASNVQQVRVEGESGRVLTHTVPRIGNLLGWSQLRHRVEADRFGQPDTQAA